MKLVYSSPKRSIKQKDIFEHLRDGARSVRHNQNIPAIQRNLLAAILEGNQQEVERLFVLVDRIKKTSIDSRDI